MKLLVKDMMTRGIKTCPLAATLGEAAALLDQYQVHALFVENDRKEVLGVITDFDLMAGEWLSADKESLSAMRALTAADLMSKPVDTLDVNVPLEEAAALFLKKGVARFLALEENIPVGALSLSNFATALTRQIPARRQTVADVMSHAILSCRENTPVFSAAYAMNSSGWRSVVVVDARGKLLGVLSGYDLLPLIEKDARENVTVKEVMHAALTIDPRASLREAADMLIQNHHHRLIVTDKDAPNSFPLGALSTFDVVAEMARPDSIWRK